MKVKHIKEIIKDMKDDDEVAISWWGKDDANTYLQDNACEECGEEVAEITDEEWAKVVRMMDRDDTLYTEIYESFKYGMDKIINDRRQAEEITIKEGKE